MVMVFLEQLGRSQCNNCQSVVCACLGPDVSCVNELYDTIASLFTITIVTIYKHQ